MTVDLQDIFDRAGRNPPAPTLAPEAVLRRASRRSRNRRITAALAVAVVVTLAVGVGWASQDRAEPLPPIRPAPSPTSTTLTLARDPFLTNADLSSLFFQGIARDTTAQARQLSPCLPDPRGWGALQLEVATYPSRTDPTVTLNEFVLRFADPVTAHRAVFEAWIRLRTCRYEKPLAPPGPFMRGGFHVPLDEVVFGQAAPNTPVYVPRIARSGNVVLVVEDMGISDDRSWELLAVAMYRASPEYRAANPDAETCFLAPCALQSPSG